MSNRRRLLLAGALLLLAALLSLCNAGTWCWDAVDYPADPTALYYRLLWRDEQPRVDADSDGELEDSYWNANCGLATTGTCMLSWQIEAIAPPLEQGKVREYQVVACVDAACSTGHGRVIWARCRQYVPPEPE